MLVLGLTVACEEPVQPALEPEVWREAASGWAGDCLVTSHGRVFCRGTPSGWPTVEPQRPGWVLSSAGKVFRKAASGWGLCAIEEGGRLHCWGSDSGGRLGVGTSTGRFYFEPEPVASADRFVQVDAGHDNTCALTPDGVTYCWGWGGRGAVGSGELITGGFVSPQRVRTEQRFVSLSVGDTHVCALTGAGALFCWGSDLSGQLGPGDPRDECFSGRRHPCATTPLAILPGRRFTAVAAGYAHTCAVGGDGIASCWGGNFYGELGSIGADQSCDFWEHPAPARTGPCTRTPRAVDLPVRLSGITAGALFTCGHAVDGTAHCWGAGHPPTIGPPAVVRPGTAVIPLRFAVLRAGGRSACGITEAGEAYCWLRASAVTDRIDILPPRPSATREVMGSDPNLS